MKPVGSLTSGFLMGCVVLCLVTAGCANHRADPPRVAMTPAPENHAREVGQRFVLHSEILKEDRPYLVYLPPSYDNRKFLPQKYPVLYLLDGDSHLPWASGVVHFMSVGINFNYQIPEMIIVAIPNTDRNRDLTPTHTMRDFFDKANPSQASTGGGDNFLNFLQEELIPHIEAEYRTQPYRILVGHSLGGLFALHAVLSRPQIFQAYLAMDPSIWWDDQVLVRRAEALKTNEFRGPLYISMSGRSPGDPGPTVHEIATQHFIESLRTNGSPGFRASFQYFESENHVSLPLLSLYHGLRFIFEGYSPTGDEWDKPAALSAHFKQVSEKLGCPALPPEEYIDELGWWEFNSAHATNTALACFQLNVSNYPGSFNAWLSLADVFTAMGDRESALKYYARSLELNPNNRHAVEQIRRLKPAGPPGPLADGVYKLINKGNGMALEVANGGKGNRVPVSVGRFANGLHQLWTFANRGDGYYQITALHSRKALDIPNQNEANGVAAIQWTAHDGANQTWQIIRNHDGTYRLVNEHSRLVLQTPPAKTGTTSVEQWPWRDANDQKWQIIPVPRPLMPKNESDRKHERSA